MNKKKTRWKSKWELVLRKKKWHIIIRTISLFTSQKLKNWKIERKKKVIVIPLNLPANISSIGSFPLAKGGKVQRWETTENHASINMRCSCIKTHHLTSSSMLPINSAAQFFLNEMVVRYASEDHGRCKVRKGASWLRISHILWWTPCQFWFLSSR